MRLESIFLDSDEEIAAKAKFREDTMALFKAESREAVLKSAEAYITKYRASNSYYRDIPLGAVLQILSGFKGNISKVNKEFNKYGSTYFYARLIKMDNVDIYGYNNNPTDSFEARMIFKIGDDLVHAFELYGFSEKDILGNLDKVNVLNEKIFKIFYSYLIHKGKMAEAEVLYERLVREFFKDSRLDFDELMKNSIERVKGSMPIIQSDLIEENIPAMKFADKHKLIDKDIIKNYMVSMYKRNTIRKNTFDRTFYRDMQRKYGKIFRGINVSSYFDADKKDKPIVSNFDLVESDPVARERIFRVFDGDAGKILKDMIDADAERTHALVISFLNIHYYKGKRQKQFISTYTRLKDIFERKNHKLDVFQLNDDLQSHIVLDMLN